MRPLPPPLQDPRLSNSFINSAAVLLPCRLSRLSEHAIALPYSSRIMRVTDVRARESKCIKVKFTIFVWHEM